MQDHGSAAMLDFTLDDVVARSGWLRRVSRRRMQAGAKLAELAVMAAAALAAARASAPAGPAALLAPAAIIAAAHAAFLASGLYGIDRLIEPERALRKLAASWTLVFLAAAALPVLTGRTAIPAAWLLTFYAIGLPGLVVTRWRLEAVLQAWVAHGHCTKSVAVVGANESASALIRRLRQNRYGIRVTGVFDDRAASAGRTLPLTRLGSVADLAALAEPVDLIVITLPLTETARISTIIAQLRGTPSSLRILPGAIGLDLLSPMRLLRGELPGIQLVEVERK